MCVVAKGNQMTQSCITRSEECARGMGLLRRFHVGHVCQEARRTSLLCSKNIYTIRSRSETMSSSSAKIEQVDV